MFTARLVQGLLLSALMGLAAVSTAEASGDLLVAPTRVVLTNTRSSEVVLSNTGSEITVYRISLELRRMRPDGQLDKIPSPNAAEQLALSLVSYAPRRVAIGPGQTQTVRIGMRPPAGLADGEYRVHLTFRAVPQIADNQEPAADGGLGIKLTPIFGVSIPVIFRVGQTQADVTIPHAKLIRNPDGRTAVSFTLHRQGNASVYGDALLFRSGQQKPLAQKRGIAVYPEVSDRELNMLLPEEFKLSDGTRLQLRYISHETGGERILAETELGLN
jgi:P pilus assembly chaperone PapD